MTELHDRVRAWWDEDAGSYDASANHAMSDPVEAAAWTAVLTEVLPPPPASVLDVGAGTGALSLAAASLGHRVTALDLSESMLARAREKADARGLDVTFVIAKAEQPPSGPFDAVIERHLAWTLPAPVDALAAWRRSVRGGGRLAMFEGAWGGRGFADRARAGFASMLARLYGVQDHHHAPYPEEIVASMPLAGVESPAPFVAAITAAGWKGVRIHRLHDVEWAIERRSRWPLGALERRARFALVADAPAEEEAISASS